MNRWFGILALGAAALIASPALALDFEFSFSSGLGPFDAGDVAGTVTGELIGLQDNAKGQLPTQILLDSFPSGMGISKAAPFTIFLAGDSSQFNAGFGGFIDVANGQITSIAFDSFDIPDNILLELNTFVDNAHINQLFAESSNQTLGNANSMSGATYTPLTGTGVPVPEPSSLLLLTAGFAGLAARRRRVFLRRYLGE